MSDEHNNYVKNQSFTLSEAPQENMPFSSIKNLEEIWEHRFNRELYNGTLPRDKFMEFLRPDVLIYLPRYTEAMNAISAQFREINDDALAEQFKKLAMVNEAYIKYIHHKYPEIKKQAARAPGFFQTAINPKNKLFVDYANHLTKDGSLAEAVARVTPCLWLYRELGLLMDLTNCAPDHPYLAWLLSYKDPEYVGLANDLVATLNQLYIEENITEKANIMVAFQQSLDFDLAIFESIHSNDSVQQDTIVIRGGIARIA